MTLSRTVWFNPLQATKVAGYSPSADKPRQLIEHWKASVDPKLFELRESGSISIERIKAVHDPAYVDRVMNLEEDNGFGTRDAGLVKALPYVIGSLVAAATWAATAPAAGDALTVTCSPTSGFHHAHYDHGGGYCTFNGLMVAAHMLLASHIVDWVAIVDCDHHYGDGTADILQRVKMPGTVLHWSAGAPGLRELNASTLLGRMTHWVWSLPKGRGLILYQAGADMHIDDPLGGRMTTSQMTQRDRALFIMAAHRSIPVCWNLAGGYQRDDQGSIRPVLDLHTNTLMASHNYE